MRHRFIKTRAASVTALAVLGVASAAQANLVLDLRVKGGGTSTTISTGSSVVLEVVANVTGATSAALQDAFFGVTNSGTVGGLSTVTLKGVWTGVATDVTPNVTTSSPGVLYPTGSTITSVGSTNSASADGWVFARSTSMTTLTGSNNVLGELTFTSGASTGTTTLAVNTRTAVNALVVPALWTENGAVKDGTGGSVYAPGTSVEITVNTGTVQVPGDADGDGDVDLDDQGIWASNFTGSLTPGTGNSTFGEGDFDGDKDVDLDDQGIWASNFTGSLAPSALVAVPEPATLGLLSLGVVALAGRRVRRA